MYTFIDNTFFKITILIMVALSHLLLILPTILPLSSTHFLSVIRKQNRLIRNNKMNEKNK